MNKHLHRIIFSAARGQRMVVAETARSQDGASSGERRAPLAASVLAGAATAALTALAFGVLVTCVPAHSQIRADASAPGNQRPTVLQTANGTPQVNIQTPSAAGVSRNVYSQFDVLSNGAVLNNSRTNTTTRIAGTLTDGTTINVRSVSSSQIGRWTIDIQGSVSLQAINPNRSNRYEIKFK